LLRIPPANFRVKDRPPERPGTQSRAAEGKCSRKIWEKRPLRRCLNEAS
jgi:hypothetical protein